MWQKHPGKCCADTPISQALCHLVCRHLAQCEAVLPVQPVESFGCLLRAILSLGEVHRAQGVPLSAPVGRRATGALLPLRVLPQGPHIKWAKSPSTSTFAVLYPSFFAHWLLYCEKKYKRESQLPIIIKFHELLSKLKCWDSQGSQA